MPHPNSFRTISMFLTLAQRRVTKTADSCSLILWHAGVPDRSVDSPSPRPLMARDEFYNRPSETLGDDPDNPPSEAGWNEESSDSANDQLPSTRNVDEPLSTEDSTDPSLGQRL